MKIDKLFFAPF